MPRSKKVESVGMILDWKGAESGSMEERSWLRCLEMESGSGASVRMGLWRGCFFASSSRSFIGRVKVGGFGAVEGALEGEMGRAPRIFLRGPWAPADS